MITQSPVMPRAWINTLVLAGMGALAFATSLQAQGRHAYISQDAADDAYIGDEFFQDSPYLSDGPYGDEVAQVGCFDEIWDGGSHNSCDGCGKTAKHCCCEPWWTHRCGAFAEFLLLRPGNVDQIYTIEQNTVTPGEDPTGPVGRLNVDEESGYRVGFSICASECTSLVGSWTKFEGKTRNGITARPGNFLNSEIIHPSTITTGASSLQSVAAYDIDFQLLDLAYRHIWKACDTYAINWLAGFRYGEMEQDLITQQQISVATGTVRNDIDVDFNGFGMMFGVDAERRSPCTGMMVYSRALSSFLAGDWRGSYVQTNQFGGGVVANEYEDYRVTPVLELELGLGWRSQCGRCRASVGYLTSAWYDAVSTREYVDSVRRNDYVSIDETITFSGMTARIEANF